MSKTGAVIILSAGVLTAACFWACASEQTGDSSVGLSENQVLNDEGYGNEDVEYYGSKDDLVNDDLVNDQGPARLQENLSNAQ